MNRIDQTFRALRSAGRKAFIPFLTAGDPDLETTALLARELGARGAALIELGIPYSDPIADGPVIQDSYTRALDRGIHLRDIFAAVHDWTAPGQQSSLRVPRDQAHEPRAVGDESQIRGFDPGAVAIASLPPLVCMVSYSIVYRHGPPAFVQQAKQVGFEGAIVPDLPVEEAAELARIAAQADFSLVQLITPTTPPARTAKIAATSTGFIYYVSLTGITGERDRLPPELPTQIRRLRDLTDLPVCVGFGVSRPQQVRELRELADGVIVGSAIVRRVAAAAQLPRDRLAEEIGRFATELIEVLNA